MRISDIRQLTNTMMRTSLCLRWLQIMMLMLVVVMTRTISVCTAFLSVRRGPATSTIISGTPTKFPGFHHELRQQTQQELSIRLQQSSRISSTSSSERSMSNESDTTKAVNTIEEASAILQQWDVLQSKLSSSSSSSSLPETIDESTTTTTTYPLPSDFETLRAAVLLLNSVAAEERAQEHTVTTGRCMLGICAPNPERGIAALKSWVTCLSLPRGLLHGMDKDGVSLLEELQHTAVYIKYNSGGVYTFSDIRKSGLGFDALWKPGDALLEPYDGIYRGVYFQVELADGVFRQYLLPLDTFE